MTETADLNEWLFMHKTSNVGPTNLCEFLEKIIDNFYEE